MLVKFSDGSRHDIINPMMIAPYKNKYLTLDATFMSEDEVIHAPIRSKCDGCNVSFEERPVQTMFLSEDKSLNKTLGRPGRVCVVCFFRPYYEAGHKIPSRLVPYF